MKRTTHRTEMLEILSRKRIPIRLQFGLFIAFFTAALMFSVLYFNIQNQRKMLTRERITVGQTLTAHLAAAAKDAILLDDDLYVYDIMSDMIKNDFDKDIRYIYITDTLGKVLLHNETGRLGDSLTDSVTLFAISNRIPVMQRTLLKEEEVLDFSRPIIENITKKSIGFVRLGISQRSISRLVEKSTKQTITISLVVLFLGLIASLFWVRLVTRPIAELAHGAEIIGTGDLSHRFNIKARNELGELSDILNRMTADLDHAQLELLAKQRLDHELDLARSLQSALLPDKIPQQDKLDIAAWYRAAKQVGGDYYDFILIDKNHIGIVIADVSGKSITGAFMMGITRAIMRAVALKSLSPKETLCRLNEALIPNMRKGMFVTMLYAIIDLDSLQVRVASAGHDPLFYKPYGAESFQLINPKGCAIGVSRDTFAAKLEEAELHLSACDLLSLTTDGINEATSKDGLIFGENAMYALLSEGGCENSNELLERLTAALTNHYDGADPSDDATIVILKVKQI